MIHSFHPTRLAGLFLATALAASATPFDAASATSLIEKHKDAIVEVRLVATVGVRLLEGPDEIAEMIAQTPGEEHDVEAKGVTIHPSGLVAVPGLPLDPTFFISEITLPTPIGELKLGIEALLGNVRILTADGREHEADVVMRDLDTGLMLVKPREAAEDGRAALVPDADAPHPAPFTQVLCLSRMIAEFADEPTVSLARTTGALDSRRGIDALTDASSIAIGAAVFDESGRFLGVALIPSVGGGGSPSVRDVGLYLLPAASLHNLAKDHID